MKLEPYVIMTGDSHRALMAICQRAMKDGYVPTGGPWIDGGGTHQALYLPRPIEVCNRFRPFGPL